MPLSMMILTVVLYYLIAAPYLILKWVGVGSMFSQWQKGFNIINTVPRRVRSLSLLDATLEEIADGLDNNELTSEQRR